MRRRGGLNPRRAIPEMVTPVPGRGETDRRRQELTVLQTAYYSLAILTLVRPSTAVIPRSTALQVGEWVGGKICVVVKVKVKVRCGVFYYAIGFCQTANPVALGASIPANRSVFCWGHREGERTATTVTPRGRGKNAAIEWPAHTSNGSWSLPL